jgi:hypothetical protein
MMTGETDIGSHSSEISSRGCLLHLSYPTFVWLVRRAALLTLLALLLSPIGPSVAEAQQGATMTVLRGQVAVLHPDGSAVQPAPSGITVFPGDEIRTLGGTDALITFFTGIEIEMGSDTILVVERVSRQGERVDISLKQVFGVAISRVQTLADPNSTYQISLGGATAVARGSVGVGAVDPPFASWYTSEGLFNLDLPAPAGVGYWWQFDPGTGQLISDFNQFGLQPGQSPWDSRGVVLELQNKAGQQSEDGDQPQEDDEDQPADGPIQDIPPPGPAAAAVSGGATSFELLGSRLLGSWDGFAVVGSLMVLGMIGWTLYGYPGGRRR